MFEENRILICSHGMLADVLVQTAELICGKMTDTYTAGLMPGMSPEEYYKEILAYFYKKEKGSTIILVDLFGGTPCNVASQLLRTYDLPIVAGVNLPMLLEVYAFLHEKNVRDLGRIAVETAMGSAINVSDKFKSL